MNSIKDAKTWDEQKDILLSRGLKFDDDDKCIEFLQSINYYRLSAYLLPYKKTYPFEHYDSGITLDHIMVLYEFDKELRHIIFSIIEEIEVFLRTQVAYYITHARTPFSYLYEEDIYRKTHNHEKFISLLKDAVRHHKHTPIVQRYIGDYFPIWVMVEFFSIGTLSTFYRDLVNLHQKAISNDLYRVNPKVLINWFVCLTNIRNRCAHYERLYFSIFHVEPIFPNKQKNPYGNKLFAQLIVLKNLFKGPFKWLNYVERISSLVQRCQDYIELEHIGFPENWVELLNPDLKIQTGYTLKTPRPTQ